MDFLASFNLGNETASSSNNVQLASIDDLKQHLQRILDAKVTPTRTEHVEITVELRSTVQLTLQLSAAENNALAGLSSIDPSLGGASSLQDGGFEQPDGEGQGDGLMSRRVTVNDTLVNQPRDNPTLQRAVAQHIANALGTADESTWAVREMARGSKGWSFTYLCTGSLQTWRRQVAKSHGVPVIGEYSYKDPDPVLMGRPAFDCRGSLVIAFSRDDRAIVITYRHTPLHQTVGQLSSRYKPPQKELGPGVQKPKTPKRTPGSSKKDSARAKDGSARPKKKRSRKKDGDVQTANAAEDSTAPSETTAESAVAVNGTEDGQQSDPSRSGSAQTSAQTSGAGLPLFNVTPAEATRRREAAVSMLYEAGVDPETLSAEQFSIFSNQPPGLQAESLKMLAKYGAERLRIVHPSTTAATPQTSGASGQASQATATGSTTTKELVPQAQVTEDGEAEKARPKKKTKAAKGEGKSRIACVPCKERRVKCPREKPTCRECQEAGLVCEYPPPKPPKTKNLSEVVVIADDDADDQDDAPNDNTNDEDVEAEAQEENVQQEDQMDVDMEEHPHQPQHNQYPEPLTHSDGFHPGYGQHVTADPPVIQLADYRNPHSDRLASNDGIAMSGTAMSLPEQQPPQTTFLQSATDLAVPRPEPAATSHYVDAAAPSVPMSLHSQNHQSFVNPQRAAQHSTSSPRASQAVAAEGTDARATSKSGRRMLVDQPQAKSVPEQLPSRSQAYSQPPQQQTPRMGGRGTPDQVGTSAARRVPTPGGKARQSQGKPDQTPLVNHSTTRPYQQQQQRQQQTAPLHTLAQPQQHSQYPAQIAAPEYKSQDSYDHNMASTHDHASTHRIGYVPYAQEQQHRNSRSLGYQGHDYGLDMASTLSTAGSAGTNHLTPQASNAQASQASAWHGTQGRDARSQTSHTPLYNTQTTTPYTQPTTTGQDGGVSVRDYHMRAASSQASRLGRARVDGQQSQSPHNPTGPTQPPPPPPQQQTHQQPQHATNQQRQGWYDFNNPSQQHYASSNHQTRQHGW